LGVTLINKADFVFIICRLDIVSRDVRQLAMSSYGVTTLALSNQPLS